MITTEGFGASIPAECSGMTLLECHDLAAELCRQGTRGACDLASETFTTIMSGEGETSGQKKIPVADWVINLPWWVIGATVGLGIGLYFLWKD